MLIGWVSSPLGGIYATSLLAHPFVYRERMGDPMNNGIYQAGQRLRQIREELGLTLKEVEKLSRCLAEEMQITSYLITAARVDEVRGSVGHPGHRGRSSCPKEPVLGRNRMDVLLRFSCSRPPSLKHLARKIDSPHRS